MRSCIRLGKMMADGINEAIRKTGVRAICYNYGSIWCVYFTADKVESYRDIIHFAPTKDSRIDRAYHVHLLNNGIYMQPNYTNRAFISYAHTEDDVQKTIEVSATFFAEHASALGVELDALTGIALLSWSKDMKRVGVDIGGTFTDLVVLDEETGDIRRIKTADHASFARRRLSKGGIDGAKVRIEEVSHFLHGTTLVTNLIIERTGAQAWPNYY